MSVQRTLFEGTTQPASGTTVSTGAIPVEPGDLLVAWATFSEIGAILSATLSDSGASTPAWENVESAVADIVVMTAGTLAINAAESITVTMTTTGTVTAPRLIVARLRSLGGTVSYVSRTVVASPNSGSTGVISAGTITTSSSELAIAAILKGDTWYTITPSGSMVAVAESVDFIAMFERNGAGSSVESFDNGLGGARGILALYEASGSGIPPASTASKASFYRRRRA